MAVLHIGHGRDKRKTHSGRVTPLRHGRDGVFWACHGRNEMIGCCHPVFHGRDRPFRTPSRLFSFLNMFYKVPS